MTMKTIHHLSFICVTTQYFRLTPLHNPLPTIHYIWRKATFCIIVFEKKDKNFFSISHKIIDNNSQINYK